MTRYLNLVGCSHCCGVIGDVRLIQATESQPGLSLHREVAGGRVSAEGIQEGGLAARGKGKLWTLFIISEHTPQIVYKVAICPRGNLPYIHITSIVLPYSQSTNYLVGTYLSWRKST